MKRLILLERDFIKELDFINSIYYCRLLLHFCLIFFYSHTTIVFRKKNYI